MSQHNPPAPPAPPSASDLSSQPSQPAKKKKRLWLKILLGLVVVLVLVVIFLPQIASSGMVRSFVVGKINGNLNGRVSIADWSLGWGGPIVVDKVNVYDEKGRLILEIGKVKTDLSLLNAIKGNLALGETTIDGLNLTLLEIDEQGKTNYERLAKPSPETPKEESGPLPDIRGNLKINDMRGTIVVAGKQTVHLDASSIAISIPDINQPIEDDIKLALRVGDQKDAGTISLAGKVNAIEKNQVKDPTAITADQKLAIAKVDLAALTPILKMAGTDIDLGGLMNGDLNLNATGVDSASAEGNIAIANFSAGGAVFNGDKYSSSKLNIPIKATRSASGGKTLLKVDTLRVETDNATIDLAVNAPQESITRLAEIVPVAIGRLTGSQDKAGAGQLGGEGQVVFAINADVAAIVKQLPNTIPIRSGTTLDSGKLAHTTTVNFSNNQALIDMKTDLTDVAGTSNQKPVKLEPTHYETKVTVLDQAPAPDLRDFSVVLNSAFAHINGAGASLAKITVNGDFDLAKFQSQVEQFVLLGDLLGQETAVQIAGMGKFTVNTEGDLMGSSASDVNAKADLTLDSLHVAGLQDVQTIDNPHLAINTSATINRTADKLIAALKNASLAMISGDASSPTVDLLATADVDATTWTAPRFEIARLTIPDLAKAQKEFGGFVPALQEMQIQLASGSLNTTAAGSYDGKLLAFSKPLAVSIKDLTLIKGTTTVFEKETIDVGTDGKFALQEPTDIQLSALSVKTSSNFLSIDKSPDQDLRISLKEGQPQGSGSLKLGADLRRLVDVANAFGEAGEKEADAPQIRRGRLDGTVAFSRGATATDVKGDFAISDLTIPKYLERQKLNIALNASAPDKFDAITAQTVSLKSAFAAVDVKDAKLLLAKDDGSEVATFEMLQGATVMVDAPDLPKLYAFINAMSPPAKKKKAKVEGEEQAAPEPPLEITKGSAAITLNVAREGQTTKVNVTQMKVNDLALAKGNSAYQFDKPIEIALASTLDAAQEITGISVSSLTGKLGVADLTMTEPVQIKLGDHPTAQGAVRVTGDMERVSGLLAALQGQPLPYRGQFDLTQTVGSSGNDLTIRGTAAVSKFQVLDAAVGSSRVDLQACKLEYSIVSPK